MFHIPSIYLIILSVTAIAACTEANRRPVVREQTATTDEDVAVDLRVLDGAEDPDGDALSVLGATAPGHGIEIVDRSVIRVTPKRDFHGVIEVHYEVGDGVTVAVLSRAAVTVRPVNDAPVATGGSRAIHGTDPVMLEGSDADGDALSYEVLDRPAHGTLTGDPPALQYTPDSGYIGDDVIMYRVSDGTVTSPPAQLDIHVGPGAAPVATSEVVAATEDQQVHLTLHASDVDGDALHFRVVTRTAHGTLDGVEPDLLYTPDPDFQGDDTLSFTASDDYLTSGEATLTIRVAAVNDPPVAAPQAVPAREDSDAQITLAGSDVDGDALAFEIKDRPQHGTLSVVTGATVTYTPATNYHGPDRFSFTVSDGKVRSAAATVDLNVASVDDPPVAISFDRTFAEDTPSSVTLVGSDPESDPLHFEITERPGHGVLSGDPPGVTYTPDRDFTGDDSFRYTVSDGVETSAAGTVTLHVTPVNDPPVAVDSTEVTDEDTAIEFTLQASDVDSAMLTYTIFSAPFDGTLSGSGATRRYTPAANATGTRTFQFAVSDVNRTATASVTLTINPVNDAPAAIDDFAGTDAGAALTFDPAGNDHDIDGDHLTVETVAPPAHGTAELVDGKLVYTPDAGFTGIDVFGYTVGDGHGGSASSTVHLGVGAFPPGAPNEAIATLLAPSGSSNADRAPAVSSDGRFLAFATSLALIDDDRNNRMDVYLYDRSTRAFTLVSRSTAGEVGDGHSTRPDLSGNARYIVFQSDASNLVAGDSNARLDVFRRDRVTGETLRISVASDATQGNGNSSDAEVSEDGNLVAFTSTAFNLVGGDANGAADIFLRDVAAGRTERVSVGASGGDTDLGSREPAISGDGRLVAFASNATNLVPGDGNQREDLFVRDRGAGTTTRVSVSTTGAEANGGSHGASMSRDGRFVSFVSSATNLVPGGGSTTPLYVRDVPSQTTTRAPGQSSPTGGQLSGDGRFAATYDGFSNLVIGDRFAGTSAEPSGADDADLAAISDNGRYIVAVDRFTSRLFVVPNPFEF